jgi:hypothetical protein
MGSADCQKEEEAVRLVGRFFWSALHLLASDLLRPMDVDVDISEEMVKAATDLSTI